MPIDLRHAIGAAWIEGGCLPLRHFHHLTKHLAGTGLVHANARIDDANRIEQPCHTQAGYVAGKDGLVPRGLHEGLGSQIVDLIRPVFFQNVDQRNLVPQIAGDELYFVLNMFDTVKVDGACPAHHADDFIPLA